MSGQQSNQHGIRIEDVAVRFPSRGGGDERTVLSDFDLEVPGGQFLAVVGKSGCGKTTMLNMVAGLVEPAEGEVTVVGSQPKQARSRMGFMPARDALLPWRTALGNVEYGLELRGMKKADRRELSRRWLKAVHLPDSEHLYPWQLSQGMRQRVALARTWVLDPDVLLMDEPFAALDVNTRKSVQAQFLDLWQREQHRTVLFVTHDLVEAVTLADRVVLMGEGCIVDDVTVDLERPRDLATIAMDPHFQRIYEHLRSQLHN